MVIEPEKNAPQDEVVLMEFPALFRWKKHAQFVSNTQLVLLINLGNNSVPCFAVNNAIASASPGPSPNFQHADKLTKELFLTFRCFCTRKDIRSLDITLRDTDVAKALSEYASYAAIEHLVLGASRGGLIRKFKQADIPAMVSRGAPDFCNVYVISKSKISSLRKASRSAPFQSPLKSQLDSLIKEKPSVVEIVDSPPRQSLSILGEKPFHRALRDDQDVGRSGRINERLLFGELPESDTDLSFVSSERTSIDHFSPLHYDYMDPSRTPRISTSSDHSFGSVHFGQRANDMNSFRDFSFISQESGMSSIASSHHGEDVENEMRRLRLELKQTMEMYSEACKEAVTAKERERQRAMDLHRWRHDEDMKMESAVNLQEASMMLAERGKSNMTSESGKERTHEQYTEDTSTYSSIRYRKYSIEEIEAATNNFSESLKIGEGGYGPVFKCNLDHTKVAVKVLRPDAAQGRTQFQQEVEVLSCIRHPHMVLLLGACPEYGCIVYEHMENGSLDDRLFCRGKTPPLCWQVRFRVAAEVATGLHFLHQTKPEPLVHRDLKPGNILLDRYFVSKIGDVGLARLVPPTVADHITQYCMTSAAGTFCYIDPEYQLTGMLGVKSDVYSLGVVLLQIITARPPMGLAHQVGRAIERGTFSEILDPLVPDWPVEEALCLAKIAIQCAEMRRKDRPDLGKEVLPELNRLKDFADDRTPPFMFYVNAGPSPAQSQTSATQVIDPAMGHSAASSMNPPSSTSSPKAISGEAE
ncbi:U-box domain-containing protein 52-like [Silene latifolia]|uniref:U-box domain-containing protein 52-like n=1 Tax=Silene latifolia TaxID=37657 RepID=UPI003D76A557